MRNIQSIRSFNTPNLRLRTFKFQNFMKVCNNLGSEGLLGLVNLSLQFENKLFSLFFTSSFSNNVVLTTNKFLFLAASST